MATSGSGARAGPTDDELDSLSRRLLNEIDDLKSLEERVRAAARSTPEFHDLNDAVAAKAHGVFQIAVEQQVASADDSPDPAERAEQQPGDWADGARPRGPSEL